MPLPIDFRDSFLDSKKQETADAYDSTLRSFTQFMNRHVVGDPIEAFLCNGPDRAKRFLKDYADWLEERGLSARTVYTRLSGLKSLENFARKCGLVEWAIDMPRANPKPCDDAPPSCDDIYRFMSEARGDTTREGKRNWALILCICVLGLKRSQCEALDMSDVDLENSTIRINSEPAAMSQELREALRRWIAALDRKTGRVFVSLDRGRKSRASGGSQISGDSICAIFHSISKRAGLARAMTPERLRQTRKTG